MPIPPRTYLAVEQPRLFRAFGIVFLIGGLLGLGLGTLIGALLL